MKYIKKQYKYKQIIYTIKYIIMNNSNKITIQRGFNDQFFKMINEVISLFLEDTDYLVAKSTFERLKHSNPSVLIKGWYKFIYTPFQNESSDFLFDKFLENFAILKQQNQIVELSNFFMKFNQELLRFKVSTSEEERNVYLKIEKYFYFLNRLSASYFM